MDTIMRSDTINYEVMAIDDDYDPTKPEYIKPAEVDEMENKSTELLRQQIARLEMLLQKNQDEPSSPKSRAKKFQHYEQVLAVLRYDAGQGITRTHMRVQSDPAKQADQPAPAALARRFTHARSRTALAPAPGFGCDNPDVPQDDAPMHINRVHGTTTHHGPGEQLSESSLNCAITTWLSASVRASGCVSLKLVPSPSKCTQTDFGRGPVLHPGDQPPPRLCVPPTLASVSPLEGEPCKPSIMFASPRKSSLPLRHPGDQSRPPPCVFPQLPSVSSLEGEPCELSMTFAPPRKSSYTPEECSPAGTTSTWEGDDASSSAGDGNRSSSDSWTTEERSWSLASLESPIIHRDDIATATELDQHELDRMMGYEDFAESEIDINESMEIMSDVRGHCSGKVRHQQSMDIACDVQGHYSCTAKPLPRTIPGQYSGVKSAGEPSWESVGKVISDGINILSTRWFADAGAITRECGAPRAS